MCALVRPCATGFPQLVPPLVLHPSGCTRLGPCAPKLACWSRLPPCAPNGPAALCAQWSCGLVRPMVLRPCAPNGPVALCARCPARLRTHCNDGLFTHSSATLCAHSPTAGVRPRLPDSVRRQPLSSGPSEARARLRGHAVIGPGLVCPLAPLPCAPFCGRTLCARLPRCLVRPPAAGPCAPTCLAALCALLVRPLCAHSGVCALCAPLCAQGCPQLVRPLGSPHPLGTSAPISASGLLGSAGPGEVLSRVCPR